jgi:hypothetical protein
MLSKIFLTPRIGKLVNLLGLSLGMIGVLLIFIWGPPQPSFQQGTCISVEDGTPLPGGKTAAEVDIDTAKTEKHYRHMSDIGLVFIFFGFVCQFAGALAVKD